MSRSLRGAWVPGVPDLAFLIVLLTVGLGGRTRLMNDPGTFWHAQLGREIARAGEVPRADSFTYTRGGEPWVNQSWAYDLALAGLVDRWGWSAAVAASAFGLALLYGSLARGLVRDGASPAAALIATMLAAGIGATHFLVRPHLLTMAFVLFTLRACQSFHTRGAGAIWAVPPLVALWANIHGGFLAGPLIVATAGAGHALSGPLDRARRRRVAAFAAVSALACLATLANPHGFELYRHVFRLLHASGVVELIDEYRPMPFGQPRARTFEWVLLALVALPTFSRRRIGRYDLAHTVVWLHLGLVSIRHAPLFALAAAPGLAGLIDGLPRLEEAIGPSRRLRKGWSAWPVVVGLAIALAVGSGIPLGGPDPNRWPLAALPTLDRQPTGDRLFHEQDWGGLIESECRPRRLAFIDDRFELFGRAAVVEYLGALAGGPDWDALLDREEIRLVWLRPDRPLVRKLLADPRWRVLRRDAVSVLFRLDDPSPVTATAK